ncbi:hypothetical protein C8Q70DRAFT_331133 [Cubamyces menziesii]|nr:hypothetical protein C8Q70DRAFT_331133 [Cubamyces menziesii]
MEVALRSSSAEMPALGSCVLSSRGTARKTERMMLKASSARQATPDLTDPLFAVVCTRWLSLRLTIWSNSNGCLSFASVVRLQLVYNAQAATCSTSALLRRLGCNKSAWYLRHVQKLPIVPRWPPELPMLCRGVLLVARPSASLSCYRLLTLPVAKSTCRCVCTESSTWLRQASRISMLNCLSYQGSSASCVCFTPWEVARSKRGQAPRLTTVLQDVGGSTVFVKEQAMGQS